MPASCVQLSDVELPDVLGVRRLSPKFPLETLLHAVFLSLRIGTLLGFMNLKSLKSLGLPKVSWGSSKDRGF